MTEPTDADRKHAADLIYGSRPRDQVEAVARALASCRESAYRDGWTEGHSDGVAEGMGDV